MEFALAGRAIAALAVIALVLLGLQAGLRAALRRSPVPGARGRMVRILETTALPGAATLHVVEIAGRRYVLGCGGGSFVLLCELPKESLTRASVGANGLSKRFAHPTRSR